MWFKVGCGIVVKILAARTDQVECARITGIKMLKEMRPKTCTV